MSRAFCAGIAVVIALASCAHPHPTAAPAPAPALAVMPESLIVAVTDSPDSVADWLGRRGHYRIAAHGADTIRLEPTDIAGPPLILHRVPARDARDAMDAGVDVLLTGDPDAVAYAETRADLATMPLAWNRTYALVVPARSGEAASRVAPSIDTLRAQLAAGAVRVEARAASPVESPGTGMCAPGRQRASVPAQAGVPPRIVYARTDEVARSIAARLVALGAGTGNPLGTLSPSLAERADAIRAAGVDEPEVERAVESGEAAAAVVAVPAQPVPACPAEMATVPRVVLDSVPLIQTRERLIARRSLTGRPLEALLEAAGDSARGP